MANVLPDSIVIIKSARRSIFSRDDNRCAARVRRRRVPPRREFRNVRDRAWPRGHQKLYQQQAGGRHRLTRRKWRRLVGRPVTPPYLTGASGQIGIRETPKMRESSRRGTRLNRVINLECPRNQRTRRRQTQIGPSASRRRGRAFRVLLELLKEIRAPAPRLGLSNETPNTA